MASLQEAGLVRIYKKTPAGNQLLILQQRVEQLAPAGGAPDGAPASVATPEKLLSVNSNVVLVNDDILQVTFTPDAGGDGLDASDCIWSIPTVTPSGSNAIGRAQFANPAFADMTLVANEQVVAGYKVTEGQLKLAGKIFLDMQDDTA
jgi:hypothetical protein